MQNHIKSIKLHEIRDKLNLDWSPEKSFDDVSHQRSSVLAILKMMEPNGKELPFYFSGVERSMRCFSMKLRK